MGSSLALARWKDGLTMTVGQQGDSKRNTAAAAHEAKSEDNNYTNTTFELDYADGCSLPDDKMPEVINPSIDRIIAPPHTAPLHSEELLPEDFILDSIRQQFHLDIFLYQLLAHIVFPLYPLMANTYSQGWTGSWFSIETSIIFPLMSLLIIICYFGCYHSQPAEMMNLIFVVPLVYYLQHRFVCAVKYGTLSRTEYSKFMSIADGIKGDKALRSIMLGASWHRYQESSILFELSAAAASLGCQSNSLHCIVEDPGSSVGAMNNYLRWNSLLLGESTVRLAALKSSALKRRDDGTYEVSVFDAAFALCRRAWRNKCPRSYRLLGTVAMVLHILIPFVLLGIHYDPDCSPLDKLSLVGYYLCSTRLLYIYVPIYYEIFCFVLTDTKRRDDLQRMLSSMVRLNEVESYEDIFRGPVVTLQQLKHAAHAKQMLLKLCAINAEGSCCSRGSPLEERGADELPMAEGQHVCLPRLSFKHLANLIAWTHARLMFQSLGWRWLGRLNIIVYSAMAMSALFFALIVSMIVNADDTHQTFFSVGVLQLLLTIIVTNAFILRAVFEGSQVNGNYAAQSELMSIQLLKCHRIMEALRSSMKVEADEHARAYIERQLEHTEQMGSCIESMTSILETNNSLRPHRVLGFAASMELFNVVLSYTISIYGYLLSLVLSEAQQSSVA